MKDFSGIEFASEHNGTDVFRLIELAYEQGQKDGHSEQLGTNLAEVGTDLISRAQAIAMCRKPCMRNADCSDFEMGIMMLPSAQPEPLTDKEQRIFLAAIGRERKVCKEVDDQFVHEPYEVLLTKVCDEIERKVKKALWT